MDAIHDIKLTVAGRIGDPTTAPHGGLKTQEEHDAWRDRLSKPIQEGQS